MLQPHSSPSRKPVPLPGAGPLCSQARTAAQVRHLHLTAATKGQEGPLGKSATVSMASEEKEKA